MATGHIGGYLAQQPSDLTGVEDRGLRFINEDWNGSISNGIPFTLKWNETIDDEDGELKLYNVSYPQGGGVSFELVSNLTGSLANMSYVWTPKGLNGSDLYAFWVTRQRAMMRSGRSRHHGKFQTSLVASTGRPRSASLLLLF
uniref:Uncharacterized protein n=1 Tax=Bionectria ochroleuca TaxID=29856 RepID=A0A8H7NKW7_BIOOC